MELSVTKQFVILSLHPEKGRKIIHDPEFNHGLAGALLMDFLLKDEISLNEKRVITKFRRTGETVHDMLADLMENKSRPRKIRYWINRISMKSRKIFRETMNDLSAAGIIRIEEKYFLNIIPYHRYFFSDPRFRKEITDGLRNVLLHDRKPGKEQVMLIGLLHATRSTDILALYREEKKPLREISGKISDKEELSGETEKAIRETQAAVVSAVTVAVAVSHRGG